MFGFRPMETIPESNSNPSSPRHNKMVPDTSLDALLYTLPSAGSERNRPLNLDPSLFRSSSTSKIKKPTQRVRDWMKRSNSTRSSSSSSSKHQDEDPPYPSTEQHIIKIAHLGGGRVPLDPEMENLLLLAPAALQPAKTGDSRVTQWIDLYPEALAGLNSPSSVYSPQKEEEEEEAERIEGENKKKKEGEGDGVVEVTMEPVELPAELEGDEMLRPAPLRTPSNASGEGKSLREGEGAKWKPLPELPVQKAVRVGGLETPPPTPDQVGEEEEEREGEGECEGVIEIRVDRGEGVERQREEEVRVEEVEREVVREVREKRSGRVELKGLEIPIEIEAGESGAVEEESVEFGHEVERELRRAVERVVEREAEEEVERQAGMSAEKQPVERVGDDVGEVGAHDVTRAIVTQDAPGERSVVTKGRSRSITKYTRQERVWLHHNYRGEAPFLLAWGLDIKNEEDREEGLEILRELMQAEREGGQGSNMV